MLTFSVLQHGCVYVSKIKSHRTLKVLDNIGWGFKFRVLPNGVEVKGRKKRLAAALLDTKGKGGYSECGGELEAGYL